MSDWGKPEKCQGVFVETKDSAELRAQRIWRFVAVIWATWLFFAIFLWIRGYNVASLICVCELPVIVILIGIHRYAPDIRRIMNLNLAASAGGLFGVSTSDPALYGVMLFYPVSIIVASQLLGVRAALQWFFINLFAFLSFFGYVYGFDQSLTTWRFDQFIIMVGVAACVYFCCHQGEAYYRRRTADLIQLSQDLEKKSDRLQVLATTDALTGLTNRYQFQERLNELVNQAVSTDTPMVLFLIDMDGFKEINDTLGHSIGDEALIVIAERLSNAFGDRAEVARLGGDEFCILKSGMTDPLEAEEMAKKICLILSQRQKLGDREFPLGGSVGYCFSPLHAKTAKETLAFADTAMFHAKEHRLGYACYAPEMTERLVEYRTVQEKLSLALDKNEFFLVYQPQVSLESKEVIGVEALIRWRNEGEIVPPIRFIHLLERSREILPVGAWIIRESCRQLAEWNEMGFRVKISVNVSALQFNDENFYDCIVDSIAQFKIDPAQLDFEITEGLLIDDVPSAVAKLNQIKDLGASLSIDDFGTGYSSLAYLRQFPVDRLKIDRTFVKNIPDNDDGMIASSIITLAKALGMSVLAEGVETVEQLNFLKYHDCDEYQGYYFSRPVSAEEVQKFFTSKRLPLATAN
ncbi:putative bifunctional diguanylate cyclase/phosphodiesterase [Pirellulaceae bacterium SH501]